MSAYQQVLHYWFGAAYSELGGEQQVLEKKSALWWGKDEKEDQYLTEHFSYLIDELEQGKLDSWLDDAQSYIALIIVTDQFPRVFFRHTAKAFAYDKFALKLAQRALTESLDKQLKPLQRLFCYMPLEHAESLLLQEQCVELMQQLVDSVADDLKPAFQSFVGYAEQHREVIARFGRFPHRNVLLGRDSTHEEREFLQQPGAAF